MVTHGLYPPDELEKVRRTHAQSAAASGDDDEAARANVIGARRGDFVFFRFRLGRRLAGRGARAAPKSTRCAAESTPSPTSFANYATTSEPDRMSTPELDPTETAAASEPAVVPEAPPAPPRTGWRLVALIPNDGKQPPADLSDATAQNAWCAVSALWHPSLLARASGLPTIEPIEDPSAARAA